MPTATIDKPTTKPTFTLTAADRCDGCGAQAYTEVKLASKNKAGDSIISELLFCGHHFNKYEEKLRLAALEVKDERAHLSAEEVARTKE